MNKPILSYVLVALISAILTTIFQPFANLPTSAQAGCQTFSQTGKTVCGRFLQYWQSHGGLAQQGYPITNPFTEVSDLNGQSYTVQYFERAVFETHPENPAPYDVLLSQLGTFQLQRKYFGQDPSGGSPPVPPAATQPPAPPPGSEPPINLSGNSGETNTPPFALRGGTYQMDWTATLTSSSCYFGASLKSTDGQYDELFANTTIEPGLPSSGSTYLYRVPAGQFYLYVGTTGCSWTVSIQHK